MVKFLIIVAVLYCKACTCININGGCLCEMDPQKYCLSCEKEFVRKSKGWKRLSLRSCKITPSKFSQDGFLCYPCANKVKRARPTSKKGARKRVISTPAKPTAKKTRLSFTPGAQASIPVGAVKDKAVSAIHSSHYEKAMSCLLQCEQGRAAFDKVVTKIIRKETKSYPHKASLSKDVTVDNNITHWNWGEISDEAEVYLPVLTCALKAALPDPATRQGTFLVGSQKKRLISFADATMQRNQRLCMMLAIIMYSCQPRVFNFLQGCLSIQLWKHGCSQSLLSCLQNLGLTKGPSGTIGTIDRVRKGSMEKLQSWKKNIEIQRTGSKCSSSRRCLWMTDAGTSNLLVQSTDEDDLWGINEHGSAWEDDLLENETAETNHHSRDVDFVATDGRDRAADEDKSASNQNVSVVEDVPLLTWEALQNESDEEDYNGRDGDLEASDEGNEASDKDDKSASDQDGPLAEVVPLSACEAACSKSSDFNRTSDGSNPSMCTEPGYSVVGAFGLEAS